MGQEPVSSARTGLPRFLFNWEIYPIVLLAAFLRLYNIDRSIFGRDESDVYQLARDAIVHGLIPLTSNRASIGTLNPPMVVYFFMIPALFSANPIWGQAFVALLNTLAVLLTYLFTTRYYGRIAGTIAAALFATSVSAWMYSRYIWSPNVEIFLVVLFMWLLFRGVVERRKGWLFPALVLLAVLFQLHASTVYLAIPLGAAVVMAWKTIRWRDLGYAAIGIVLAFAPFLVWEYHDHLFDLKSMFTKADGHATYSFSIIRNYLFYLHPTLINPYTSSFARIRDNHLLFPGSQSILLTTPLRYTHILLQGGYGLALLLFFSGCIIATLLVLLPRNAGQKPAGEGTRQRVLVSWWNEFQATPLRQGFILLLLWQIAPLVLFVRHSIILFDHYFLFFLPGQFILIAIAVVQSIEFIQKHRPAWDRWIRYGMCAAAGLIILGQLIGTGSTLIDLTTGNFSYLSVHPNYLDLHSEQNVLQAADQLAQQRGIHRIYAPFSYDSYLTMIYLARQVKTPIEISGVSRYDAPDADCVLLPDVSAGPVVFLAEPDIMLPAVMALLNQYTTATLVSQPSRLGGAPYNLYILTAKTAPTPAAQTFEQGLTLLSPSTSFLPGTRILTTDWRVPAAQPAALRTLYHYDFTMQESAGSKTLDCQLTTAWAGDQLVVLRDLSLQKTTPTQMGFQATTFTEQPVLIKKGPLTMTSYSDVNTPTQQLLTANQQSTITLPVKQNVVSLPVKKKTHKSKRTV